MCFRQWLLANKEIISMLINIAIALGTLLASSVIIWNIRSLKLQKMSAWADLFHSISSEINAIIDEQKDIERKDEENKNTEYTENWYERILYKLEYFCFFANRKLLSRDMIEYYKPTVIAYCNDAAEYPNLLKELTSRKPGEFCEIEKYYEKYSGRKLPF